MLIAIDIGNTNVVLGVFDDARLVARFRLSSDAERTTDEYGAVLTSLFAGRGLDPTAAGGVIVASVVPPLNPTFDRLARGYFGRQPLFVEPGVRTGLAIRYDNPAEVGADRIVNAVAARELYGAPVVVVDFGTATTFDVVSPAGEYVGGIICPGLTISAEALFSHASRLYKVDIKRPDRLIASHTAGAMQAGLYYGYVGLVDGILGRLKAEIEGLETVVATGGDAELIAGGSQHIGQVSDDLTLLGLRLVHERNL
ncbi:MAG: type III pantothenate kinase [Thermoanaerobaculia bacterium]